MVGFAILITSIVGCMYVGLPVLANDVKNRTNRLYGILTFLLIVFITANYFSIQTGPFQLWYMRLVMAITSVTVAVAYLFVLDVTGARKSLRYPSMVMLIVTLPIAVLDMTPAVFSGVNIGSQGATPVAHAGVIVYLLHFLAYIGLTFYVLYAAMMRRSKQGRRQLSLIIAGIVPTFVCAPITGIILPQFFSINGLIMIAPLYALFFVICVGYAIVRHGLFDVRQAILRTTAYSLSLLVLAAIYFGMAYIASILFLNSGMKSGVSLSPNVVLALVLALIFQPIRKFFDKWTNRIFYRDKYDTDEFIARLGRVLTSTTSLRAMLDRSLREISTTLKANGAAFLVYGDDAHSDILVGNKHYGTYEASDYEQVRSITKECGRGVFWVRRRGGLSDDSLMLERLWQLLERRRVALVLPLVGESQIVGYLFLGEQMGSNYTKRDISVLEMVADELVIAIQNAHYAQIVRDMNKGLEQRIESATRELRASNKRLMELDATKDEFVSMASHQLRTPLTSIKGYISMVLEGDAGEISEQQRHLLDEAFTSSERMVRLIGDFLNVSRLNTGKFIIDRRQIDLATVVEQEVGGIRRIAATHDISVMFDKPSRFPLLYLDEGKLRQVIMNFIDNAIYYSPEATKITVSLAIEDGDAVLRVKDQGIGVPPEEQAHLFTKFFRAENARTQRPDGTGIGLYLAKRIIDGHHGKVVFESNGSRGSTFGFRLPIKKLETAPLSAPER